MSMPIKNFNEQREYKSYGEPFRVGYQNSKPNAPPIDQQPRGYQPLQERALFPSGESQPVTKHSTSAEEQPKQYPSPAPQYGQYTSGPGGGYSPRRQYSPPDASGQNHSSGQNAPPSFQGAQQPVVVTQPRANRDGWMNMPAGVPNCPPGLEYLTTIDQLLVKQKVELLEALTGFETNNKFTIKNSLGKKVFWAVEENDCCTRNMCGPARPFEMKVLDIYKNQVMHMHRPLACSSCCFPCCLQSMEVSAPPGNVIGTIEQEWSICTPEFTIRNNLGDAVLRIEGPFCTFTMCGDVEFKVVSLTGKQIGKISKHWSGLAREMFTDADFFGISFPLDLDVKTKAVLLGACYLVDAMYFETQCSCVSDCLDMICCFVDTCSDCIDICSCFGAMCSCFVDTIDT